jgi:hypothetical protein
MSKMGNGKNKCVEGVGGNKELKPCCSSVSWSESYRQTERTSEPTVKQQVPYKSEENDVLRRWRR